MSVDIVLPSGAELIASAKRLISSVPAMRKMLEPIPSVPAMRTRLEQRF